MFSLNPQDESIAFQELTLDKDQIESRKVWGIESTGDEDKFSAWDVMVCFLILKSQPPKVNLTLSLLQRSNYAWLGNTLYGLKSYPLQLTTLFEYNLDMGTMQTRELPNMGQIFDLLVDENGVLVVHCQQWEPKQHICKRVELR